MTTPGIVVFTNNAELLHQLRHQLGDASQLSNESIANIADLARRHPGVAVVINLGDKTTVESSFSPDASSSLIPSFEPASATVSLENRVEHVESRLIQECLARNSQRRKETAAELGISRVTLYNKMKKFGLL